MQHDVARGEDGLAGVALAGTEDDGRLEADGVLVEGAEAVEISRHHRDVAHAHPVAHLRCPGSLPASDPHTLQAFTGMERFVPYDSVAGISTVHDSATAGSAR